MILLWLLILRGIGVELRMHLESPVWRGFFDGAFSLSSLLLTVFFGAALGNVIRGVPLQKDGYFFLPLWTDWRVGALPGVLAWDTVLAAVAALVALTLHGAHYGALKALPVYRPDLVELRHAPGSRIFCLRLSHVQGQDHRRGRPRVVFSRRFIRVNQCFYQ